MKRILITVVFIFSCVGFISAQNIDVKTNHEQEKEFGPEVEQTLTDSKSGSTAIVKVSVMLKKPIPMGCQYVYRINNTSDKTLKVTTRVYEGQFQMKGEKIKPGESVDFLVNTMSRCEGKTNYEKCIDCQPTLDITNVEIK